MNTKEDADTANLIISVADLTESELLELEAKEVMVTNKGHLMKGSNKASQDQVV
jgi:hypothetical protein